MQIDIMGIELVFSLKEWVLGLRAKESVSGEGLDSQEDAWNPWTGVLSVGAAVCSDCCKEIQVGNGFQDRKKGKENISQITVGEGGGEKGRGRVGHVGSLARKA